MPDTIEGKFRVVDQREKKREPIIKSWKALFTVLAVFAVLVLMQYAAILKKIDDSAALQAAQAQTESQGAPGYSSGAQSP